MVRSASRVSTPAEGVLKQEISFPQPPAPELRDPSEPLSFWETVAQVPLEQWATEGEKGYKIYLFEGFGLKGPYLAKITEAIDIEWVKQSFGGGDYSGTLNSPGGKIESSIRFSVHGDKKSKPPQNAQNSTSPQHIATMDSFQSQVLEIMRESTRRQEQMMERIIDARGAYPAPAPAVPAIDPNIMLRGVVDMFSGLLTKAQTPQPQMGLLEMVALIEKFKGPDLLTVLTQAKTAGLIPAASGSGDLMGQLTGVIEVAEKIGLTSGKGGKSLGEAVIEKLPDILEAGGKAMDKYHTIEQTRLQTAREVRAIQQQRNGVVITPPPQQPAGQMPQHASQPQSSSNAQPAAPAYGLDVEAPGSPAAAAIAEAEQQDAFIKGKIVEAIAHGDSGGEIIDFLDKIDKTICDRFSGASVEQIVYFFSNDPVLRKAASLPRFKPAIAEIVEELDSAPDEDMEAPAKVN